jgi:hypothetical protein
VPHKRKKHFVPGLVHFKLTKREKRYARFRARLVKLLGMAPEDTSTAEGRYVATTGELLRYAKEKYKRKGYSPEEVAASDRKRAGWWSGN